MGMDYRLNVSFRSQGKTYVQGCILPGGVSPSDLDFLKRKGFVEPVDIKFPSGEDSDLDSGGSLYEGQEQGDGISFPDFQGLEDTDRKTSEEIQKMRSKEEVFLYAQSIGLDLGENYKEKSLKELQESVMNFQEEAAAQDRR